MIWDVVTGRSRATCAGPVLDDHRLAELLRAYLDDTITWEQYVPRYLAGLARPEAQAAIAEVRRRTAMTLMTGLNHVTFAEESAPLVRAQVKRAVTEGGSTRFILAPGCSLPTYTYPPLIRAARAESSEVGRATAGGGSKR